MSSLNPSLTLFIRFDWHGGLSEHTQWGEIISRILFFCFSKIILLIYYHCSLVSFSLDHPMIKNQILNTKPQTEFLVVYVMEFRKEKRPDSQYSFQIMTMTKNFDWCCCLFVLGLKALVGPPKPFFHYPLTDIWCLVFCF